MTEQYRETSGNRMDTQAWPDSTLDCASIDAAIWQVLDCRGRYRTLQRTEGFRFCNP